MSATPIVGVGTAAPAPRSSSTRRARARMWDRIATGTLWSVAGFITLVFAFIVLYTVLRGLPSISLDFFKSGDNDVGIASEIFNTFYLLFLSLLLMVPIGIGAAIYLVEYARNQRFLSILRFATETLTSMPTLIIGLFGAIVFSENITIIHIGGFTLHGFGFGFSRISGALTLALLNLPWMLRTSEDALRAVPSDLREASLALGATRWQTAIRTIIPAAIPGLVTSILIVAGRVIGETAALIYTTGTVGSTAHPFDLNLARSGETLAQHAYILFGDPTAVSEKLRLGTALTLIVLVLLFNVTARIIGNFLNTRVSGSRS